MPPVVSLDRVSLAYGHLPLLDAVSLAVDPGERVCVLGRNGAGKSTLLRVLGGEETVDGGTVSRQPGARAARLEQDVPLSADRPVFDVVSEGLGDLSALVSAYHHAAVDVAREATPARLERLGRLHHELDERDGWRLEQRVELIVSRLGLPADSIVDTLSGGWRRRVLLARALVHDPELLMLDEPLQGLDRAQRVAFRHQVESLIRDGHTVLYVSHHRDDWPDGLRGVLQLDRRGGARVAKFR